MKKIFITYCSAKKNDKLKNSNIMVVPEQLYTSERIQLFMKKCKELNVPWAIFSDLYGIVFPDEKLKWYDKHPNDVTDEELEMLVQNCLERLKDYDVIYFYYQGNLNYLYRRLFGKLTKFKRVKIFNDWSRINVSRKKNLYSQSTLFEW